MLNQKETTLLQGMIDASPDLKAHYSFTFPDEDNSALDRLLHLGLVNAKSWNPVHYELTDSGRHYFRDMTEEAVAKRIVRRLERRDKILYLVIGALIGSIFTKLADYLYRFIAP